MPLAKNREQITVSTKAHAHLRSVVDAMRKNGIPTSGTLLASEVILAIPIPQATTVKPLRKARKASAPVTASAQA